MVMRSGIDCVLFCFRCTCLSPTSLHMFYFCHAPSKAPSNEREFEDEVGEELLNAYLSMKHPCNPSDSKPAFSSGQQSASSSTDKPHMNQAIEELGRTAIDLALSQWGIAIDESLAACAYMASKLNDFDTGNLDAGLGVPLSLVLRDESTRGLSAGVSGGWDVSFVTWYKPYRKLQGRVVTLDADNCVMYPSHFKDRETFEKCVFVLPNATAKIRKKERELIPQDVSTIYQMCSVALDPNELDCCLDEDDSLGVCIACQHDATHGPLKRCALCLHRWHDSCSLQSALFVSSFVVTNNVKRLAAYEMSASELPVLFLHLVCINMLTGWSVTRNV